MFKRLVFAVVFAAVCMSFVACTSSDHGGACGTSPTAPTCGSGGIVGTFDPVPTPETRFIRDKDGTDDPYVTYSLVEEPVPVRGSLWQPMTPPVMKLRIRMATPPGNNPLLTVGFQLWSSIDGVAPTEFNMGTTGSIRPGEDKVVQVGGVNYIPYAYNWVLLKGAYGLNDGPTGSGATTYYLTGKIKVGYHS